MDWQNSKFDWNRARAFLITAEEGSLSAAARALGMTQPTLGRQVSALEEELGVVLFERVGRGLVLTPNGEHLLEQVRQMGEAAGRVSLVASGQSQSLQGRISIATSESVAAFLLPKALKRLRREEPGIHVELVASIETSDLMRREADIAVRHYRPEEPELITRKVGVLNARMYASRDYLRFLGSPRSPEELINADFICFDEASRTGFLHMYQMLGLELQASNFSLMSKNELVAWEMVKNGVAIGVIEETVGDVEPLVERVLPDFPAVSAPMWLCSHRELRSSKRVRKVFDVLAEELVLGRE